MKNLSYFSNSLNESNAYSKKVEDYLKSVLTKNSTPSSAYALEVIGKSALQDANHHDQSYNLYWNDDVKKVGWENDSELQKIGQQVAAITKWGSVETILDSILQYAKKAKIEGHFGFY